MRLAFIAALLGVRLPAAAAPLVPSSEACFAQAARQLPSVFEVVVSAYPTVFERRLSIKEINRIRPERLPPQAIAHGLSMVDYRFHFSTKSEVIGWGTEGRVCAWIGKVVVDLTPGPVFVYIPNEYPSGTCESNVLSFHELEHEELYRRALLMAADRMRYLLNHAPELPSPFSPIDASNPEEARALLKRRVDAVARPVFDQLIKKSRNDQDSLDSPETYRILSASCAGWKKT